MLTSPDYDLVGKVLPSSFRTKAGRELEGLLLREEHGTSLNGALGRAAVCSHTLAPCSGRICHDMVDCAVVGPVRGEIT